MSGRAAKQVRRASAELLAYGLRNERLSMRQAVRLVIELFDLVLSVPRLRCRPSA